ncbi:MAG: EamA family transporter [Rhodobiaceae bacterium]|nr:MAG: EamA family transporter [Rhodobiaceae bacterium]
MTRLRADILLGLTALVWGAAFVGQATAMEHLGPFSFTGVRFLLATLVVLPFALAEHRKGPAIQRKHGLRMAAVGLIFFIASTTQQVGLLSTTVTNAGFLTALYVVFVPAVAFIALRQKLPLIVWPAAALSFAGTWALAGGVSGLTWGDAIMVVSAVFWALQVILIGAIATRSNRPVTLATIQFAVTAALGLAIGLALENPTLEGITHAWRELIFTGLISGGLGFTLQAIAQRHTPASDAAIIMSSEALFAALFGMFLLGEHLDTQGLIGCAAILGAVLLVQLVPYWRRKRS